LRDHFSKTLRRSHGKTTHNGARKDDPHAPRGKALESRNCSITGIHRETVGKYFSPDDSKPAKPDHRVEPGPKNRCETYRDVILEKLGQGLSGTRIHQDLCEEHGFTASYSSVRRFLQGLRKTTPLPFRRIETGPGEEAQVDFWDRGSSGRPSNR
jgi:hypothetical protein